MIDLMWFVAWFIATEIFYFTMIYLFSEDIKKAPEKTKSVKGETKGEILFWAKVLSALLGGIFVWIMYMIPNLIAFIKSIWGPFMQSFVDSLVASLQFFGILIVVFTFFYINIKIGKWTVNKIK